MLFFKPYLSARCSLYSFFLLLIFISQNVFAQTSPPNAPVISSIGGKSVTVGETLYTNAGQQGASSVNLVIEGFAESNSIITIYNSGSQITTTSTVTAQSNGFFQATVILGEGSYLFTAKAENAAGLSAASDPAVDTKIDTTAPSITAYNRSRWQGDSRWVRNELNSLYANIADTGSALMNSGIDFSTATGQIADQTAGGTLVPGSATSDNISRIDFIPTNGYTSGSFTDAHYYIMTITIQDKAGNIASDDNDFNIDYGFDYSVRTLYIYDPSHQTALNNNELGISEPTNNSPKTVTGYGNGWVDYYKNMHIYTNPTKLIIKILSARTGENRPPTSPWQGGPDISAMGHYIDYWTGEKWFYDLDTRLDANGMMETALVTKPKELVDQWYYIRDRAYNRTTGYHAYYYTKTGAPPAPTITDWGTDLTNFSATYPRIIKPISGYIAESSNSMIAYRYGNWPNSVKWKVVVPINGTSYNNTSGYDIGDTFIDSNNNWQWDSGEPYKNFTKPATSNGKNFTILNPLDQTIDNNGIYANYSRVYDPSTSLIGNYIFRSHSYYVDVTYPWIELVSITPSAEKNGDTYVALSNLPTIIVDINDAPFNQTYKTAFTFNFSACKIELLDNTDTVINTANTGTFAKENATVSYAKGELDLNSVSNLTQGTYTLKITVVDKFGNTTVDNSRTLIVDDTAPTVTGLVPPQNSVRSTLPNFQASLYDLMPGGGDGSGVSFGTGDQAVNNLNYSQLRPFKVIGEAAASGQTLTLDKPLSDHTGADIAQVGKQFEAWQDDQSDTIDIVTITSISGNQVTFTGTGNLVDSTVYNILYEIPYYHATNGVDTLSANPVDPIEEDGYYAVQVRAVDKVGNMSIVSSHYRLDDDEGEPPLFTSATGIFNLNCTPMLGLNAGIGLAGTSIEIISDQILTRSGNPVFDGTLVTVSTTYGNITDADQDQFTLGIQIKTVNGRAAFHVTGTSPGSGTVHAQVGEAYSSPDPTIQFIPNYPNGLSLNADTTSVIADGASIINVTSATITDQYGNTITGTNTPFNQFKITAPGFTIMKLHALTDVVSINSSNACPYNFLQKNYMKSVLIPDLTDGDFPLD
ncbi:hypothetical protein J7L67_08560 [bacterium]|nr:hypothetical protein [bacterium]